MIEMATIKAGWALQLRIHGLTPDPGLSLFADLVRVPPHISIGLLVEVASSSMLPTTRLSIPRYVVEESMRVPVRREMGDSNAGSEEVAWINAIATSPHELPDELAFRFAASPDEYVAEVENIVRPNLADETRHAAELLGGVVCNLLEGSRPELWQESRVYFHNERELKARTMSQLSEFVPRRIFTEADLLDATRSVANAIVSSDGERRILRLCSRWLLVGNSLPISSPERFVTHFQAIEAMCTLADQAPTDSDAEGFRTLDEILAASALPGHEVRRFVQRLKERTSRPPLRERFRRLAYQVRADHAQQDIMEFTAMARVRNDLVHARRSDLPREVDGLPVDETMRDLASSYFRAMLVRTLDNAAKVEFTRHPDA
jgi:hypothetical protein